MRKTATLITAVVIIIAAVILGIRNRHLPERDVRIGGETFKVEIAATDEARRQGLSGRDTLPTGRGMLFTYLTPSRYGFWMKDMRFPIDIIWLRSSADSRTATVIDIAPNIQPLTSDVRSPTSDLRLSIYYPRLPADAALELPAGTAMRLKIKIGDETKLFPP